MSPHKSLIAILMALFFIAVPRSCFAEYGTSPIPGSNDACLVIDQSQQSNQKTYEDMYQQAWSALEQKFFFRQNMGNWSQWQHKFDGKLTSLSETESAIKEMVGSLNDKYTFYLDGKDTSDKDIETKKTGVVTCKMLADDIGYIKIDTFNSKNVDIEIRTSWSRLKTSKALIIDLQGNLGGYIDESIQTASIFFQEGLFITMENQVSPTKRIMMPILITKERYTHVGTGALSEHRLPALAKEIPIVFLVDRNTASASEMLAGSFQEYKRAILIGRKTMGKGVAQELKELPYSTTLRFTYSQWTLPVSGKCIHKIGLTPDVLLQPTENALDAAVNYLRSKYANNKP